MGGGTIARPRFLPSEELLGEFGERAVTDVLGKGIRCGTGAGEEA